MPDAQKYLDAETLTKIERLDLKARLIVEGYISGLHRSPYHGFSVEFAEHREYSPGDDLKHLDWKVYGKSDRYYIKQYEEETNLRSYFLLDISQSMCYRGDKRISKLEYGKYIIASLAHLLLRQQDSVGLVTFDDQIRMRLPASASPAHKRTLLETLSTIDEAGIGPEKKTDTSIVFHDLAEWMKRKGLVVIVSDLFDDAEKILFGLQHFRHRRHEVIVFQLLDSDEISFPFQDMTLFEGMEEMPDLLSDPRALRDGYMEAFERFADRVRSGCRNNKIDYVRVNTGDPLDVVLSAYLATRASSRNL